MSAQMLATAIALAAKYHEFQTDKSGKPYILHTLKVMHYMKTDDYERMAAGVLHDIIEDTTCLYEDLLGHGLSQRIIDAVRAMTKLPGQSPEEYMKQLKTNVDACHIKLADLRHNSDIRRLKGLTEKDFKRVTKYMQMHTELSNYMKELHELQSAEIL
jgi:(p)ppGpp synthase/HD superfamily hydrolase